VDARRLIAALAALGTVVIAAPVQARGPALICKLIRDAAGDAQVVPGATDPSDSGTGALDIVSADVASNAKLIGVTIRVANLRALNQVPQGNQYDFYFDSTGQTFDFMAQLPQSGDPTYEVFAGPSAYSPNGDDTNATYSGEGIASATGVIDFSHNEIRITARLKDIRRATKVASPLRRLRAQTWRISPTPTVPAGYREDYGSGDPQYGDKYDMGRASCLELHA
jgi:hypothetical protein